MILYTANRTNDDCVIAKEIESLLGLDNYSTGSNSTFISFHFLFLFLRFQYF